VGADRAAAGAHPVDVAADRVDLAVVAEEPERLRALPRGRRVRREALVEDPERDLELPVAQGGGEGVELVGGAERLVDDRPERERRDVQVVAPVECLAREEGSTLLLGLVAPRRVQEGPPRARRRGGGAPD